MLYEDSLVLYTTYEGRCLSDLPLRDCKKRWGRLARCSAFAALVLSHLVRRQIPAVREKCHLLPMNDNLACLCFREQVTFIRDHGGRMTNQARAHRGVARKILQVLERLHPVDKGGGA